MKNIAAVLIACVVISVVCYVCYDRFNSDRGNDAGRQKGLEGNNVYDDEGIAIDSAEKFLMDRIGADSVKGVPWLIRVEIDGKSYLLDICGKDDMVGALVNDSYNVSLSEGDMDTLSILKTFKGKRSESCLKLEVIHTRESAFQSVNVPIGSDCEVLIRNIIHIFNLPTYTVQSGETLSEIIHEKFDGRFTMDELLEVNPGLDPDRIGAGWRIKIPVE